MAGEAVKDLTFAEMEPRSGEGEAGSTDQTELERVRQEVALLQRELAQRTKAEEQYRSLLDSMEQGFCVFEMIFDDEGQPVDYRFLETNPTFERHTGLVGAVGTRVRELVPGLEGHWLEIYGRVARTGEPHRFVEKSDAMGRWFEVEAFRIGNPQEHKVALLFTDITARRQTEEALRRSEERNRLLLDSAAEAIYGLDEKFRCTFANTTCVRLLGYDSPDELVGQRMHELIHHHYADGRVYPASKCRIIRAFFQGHGVHVDDEVYWRKDGSSFPVEYWSYPVEKDGAVTGLVVTFFDITGRKEAEAALRRSEERLAEEVAVLKRLHRMTGRMVASRQMQEALDEVLSAAVDLLGADFGNIRLFDREQQTLEIVAHIGFERAFLEALPAIHANGDTFWTRALCHGRRVMIEDVTRKPGYEPYLAAATAAGYRAVQLTPLASHGDEVLGILATHFRRPRTLSERDEQLLDLLARHASDVLQRLRAEEVLERRVQERTAQVRRLASELVAAEQKVRARISQTLHDDLQQLLYASEMQLHFLRDDSGPQEGFDELQEMIAEAIHLSRTLTVELNPPVLKGEGLRQTLEWLATHMAKTYGLQVTVEAAHDPPLSTEEQRVLLFQIVRELLFNIIKHAQVREAKIAMFEEKNGMKVVVMDRGRGFDTTSVLAEKDGGYGLRAMHERLQLLGGRASVESRPGAGTRVTLTLPYNQPVDGPVDEPAGSMEK
jgi:PAS domain S-box-containing protein